MNAGQRQDSMCANWTFTNITLYHFEVKWYFHFTALTSPLGTIKEVKTVFLIFSLFYFVVTNTIQLYGPYGLICGLLLLLKYAIGK